MTKKEFLAFSLPYKLPVISKHGNSIGHLTAVSEDTDFIFRTVCVGSREKEMKHIDDTLPILRPLSDLKDKNRKSVGFQTLLKVASKFDNGEWLRLLCGNYNTEELPFYVFEILIQNNFDIANLIECGEAIDYHTLEGFSF